MLREPCKVGDIMEREVWDESIMVNEKRNRQTTNRQTAVVIIRHEKKYQSERMSEHTSLTYAVVAVLRSCPSLSVRAGLRWSFLQSHPKLPLPPQDASPRLGISIPSQYWLPHRAENRIRVENRCPILRHDTWIDLLPGGRGRGWLAGFLVGWESIAHRSRRQRLILLCPGLPCSSPKGPRLSFHLSSRLSN